MKRESIKNIIIFLIIFLSFFIILSMVKFDTISTFTLVEGGEHIFSLNGQPYKINDLFVQKHELTNEQLAEILNWAFTNGYIEISNDEVYETYQGRFLIYQLEQKYSGLLFSKNSFAVKSKFEKLPASFISWYGALTIANFLSIIHGFTPCYNLISTDLTPGGNGYRIPFSYEWEYCAMGGKKSNKYKFSGSNNLSEVAWYSKNSSNSPQPIMLKKPNEIGLYDMSGNLYEWCYEMGISAGVYARGGAFNSNENQCLPTSFFEFEPLDCLINVGVRLFRTK